MWSILFHVLHSPQPHPYKCGGKAADNLWEFLVHLVNLFAKAIHNAATGVGVKETHREADDWLQEVEVEAICCF